MMTNLAFCDYDINCAECFSAKSGKVNFRAGPGEQYPIKGVIVCINYPVKVIDKFQDWRKVIDFKGSMGWVNFKMLKRSNHGIIAVGYDVIEELDSDIDLPKDVAIVMRLPNWRSAPIIILKTGVIVKVHRCLNTWCNVELLNGSRRKIRGWILERALWHR
jgi:SH3-like domain-containing protein